MSAIWESSEHGKYDAYLYIEDDGSLILSVGEYHKDRYETYRFLTNQRGFDDAAELADILNNWVKTYKKEIK